MDHLSPAVAALLLIAGAVGAVPAAGPAGDAPGSAAAQTETAAEPPAPGEQLAAVVSVQRAEVDGEVAARAFDQRLARAETNGSRAGVVADEIDRIRQRLDELAAEQRELRAAHENGSLDRGEYRAELAQLRAEQRSLERRANRTEATARALPAAALEAKGVNATAIQQLRANAANLTGPEVAEIARSVAGNNAGAGLGPSERGPPPFAGNGTRGSPGAAGPGQGPPDDAGPPNGSDNGSAGGPPADAGNGPPNGTGPGR